MERPIHSVDAAGKIWLIGSPIVFFLGVIGNIITLLVLTKNKKTSTTIFLIFLAVFDLCVIVIILPRWWFIYAINVDIRHLHPLMCKAHIFSVYVVAQVSDMCLVGITVERIICTLLPLRIHSVCTKRVTVAVCVANLVFFMAFYSHTLYGYTLTETFVTMPHSSNISNSTNASIGILATEGPLRSNEMVTDDYRDASVTQNQFYPDSSLNISMNKKTDMLFPTPIDDKSTVLVSTIYPSQDDVSNGGIVVVKSCDIRTDNQAYYKNYKNLIDPLTLGLFTMGPNAVLIIGAVIIVRKMYMNNLLFNRGKHGISQHVRQTSQVTITMVTLNCAFFIFHSPVHIMYVLRFTVLEKHIMNKSFEVWWAVVLLMFTMNHSVNFLLYVFTGARFRRQVKDLFLCQTGVRRGRHSSGQISFSVTSKYNNGESRSTC